MVRETLPVVQMQTGITVSPLLRPHWTYTAHKQPDIKSYFVAGAPSKVFKQDSAKISIFPENAVFAVRAEVRAAESRRWERSFWVVRASLSGTHNVLFIDRPVYILFSVANNTRLIKTAVSILRAALRAGKKIETIDYPFFRDCLYAAVPPSLVVQKIAA